MLVYLYEIILNYQISYSSTKPLAEVMISNHLRSLQSNPMTLGSGIEIINLLNQKGVLDGYIFPRHPVIAPEVNGVFDMFCGSSLYLFSRCLDVWGVIWKSLHPAFPQVQLDTSAVPDTNCAQTGAI